MQIWGIAVEQASEAMYNANEHYPGLIFNRKPEQYGRAVRLTLKMTSPDSDGAVGHAFWNDDRNTGRRGSHADWHVHGAFMAEIFNLNPGARIKSVGGDFRGVSEFLAHYPRGKMYLDDGLVGEIRKRERELVLGAIESEEV